MSSAIHNSESANNLKSASASDIIAFLSHNANSLIHSDKTLTKELLHDTSKAGGVCYGGFFFLTGQMLFLLIERS